ncbi:DegV family protein [Paenibacillus sp. UMB4589-SE434]|uniref:DegV family protein n=1 Tax=Paenibacillus sp. UMB4589-SE434 TaxID=3046314 RepID=UPI00255080D8|nr:DegV family protein [Paenibacillus sp. UMB4589-SE434]MDK8179255.1 DegV family protein [Paenibacillus sp. UMB4589-SE434]
MATIKIFSDSTCDLPKSLIEQYDIGIVPLYVTFGDQDFRDGVDIDPRKLYEMVDATGKLPKTAAPSPGDFASAFEPYVKEGRDIIYIGLSSHLSSTIQNAGIAAQMLEGEPGKITVIDSLNLATGVGQQVLRAARLAESGQEAAAIEAHIVEMRKYIETEFIIDTLDYLYKGGRCSGLQNIIGTLLRIRPVIKVLDGKMTPTNRVRGKRDKAVEQLLNNALSLKDQMDNDTIFVTHSFSDEDAQFVQHKLKELTGAKHVYISYTGCVISSHCGTNTIGIVFAKKF